MEIISADNPQPKSQNAGEVGYRGIALEVEDMAKAVDYLKGKGIAIAREPVDLGDSFRGEIRDPDGLIIRTPTMELNRPRPAKAPLLGSSLPIRVAEHSGVRQGRVGKWT